MEEHLGSETYSLLKKDPTESLARKFDVILKKLLKDKKIPKQLHDDSRVLHPRSPQIYSLPKIHKPGNLLRPIVSFYGTPLSVLHKQLSNILQPLTQSNHRLKNPEDFLDKFRQNMDPANDYYCSLEVKSLYTSCNMHIAVDIVMEKIKSNPEILPANITPEGIYSLLNFSLDNAYLEFDSLFYRQNIGGPMGSPLTVALAEIRLRYIEDMVIRHSTDPPSYYCHFVDDRFGISVTDNTLNPSYITLTLWLPILSTPSSTLQPMAASRSSTSSSILTIVPLSTVNRHIRISILITPHQQLWHRRNPRYTH